MHTRDADRLDRFVQQWLSPGHARNVRLIRIKANQLFEATVEPKYRPWVSRGLKGLLLLLAMCLFWKTIMEDGIAYRRRRLIVVLGDGVTDEGETPPHVMARAHAGIDQWVKSNYLATIVTVQKGSPKLPNPKDKLGFQMADASVVAKTMAKLMPSHLIMEETTSVDTIGNAYFVRTTHVDPADIRKISIVTSSWHMPRTKAVFTKIFSMPVRADSFHGRMTILTRWLLNLEATWPYQLKFIEADDSKYMKGSDLMERVDEEEDLLEKFYKLTDHDEPGAFGDLRSMHVWMFTKNEPYAVFRHLLDRPFDNDAHIKCLLKKRYGDSMRYVRTNITLEPEEEPTLLEVALPWFFKKKKKNEHED